MKKVVIVSIYGNTNGGIERVTFYMEKLLKDKFDVKVLSAKQSFGKLNMVIYPIIFSFLLLFMKRDIVIAQCWHAWLYRPDFLIGHGTMGGYMKASPECVTKGSKFVAFMERIAAKRARCVLAVSHHCGEELVQLYGIPRRKIKILNNFVREDLFYPMDCMRDYSIVRILFSGRLCTGKGIDRLLELADYIENLNDVTLYIASNDNVGIKQFTTYRNTFVRVGLNIEEMNELYNKCDVLFFPSRYEGFSMSSLEALSSGIPIIGSEYAVPVELEKYDFTCRVESYDPVYIISKARELAIKFRSERIPIHNRISKDFGEAQYKKKLMRLLKC